MQEVYLCLDVGGTEIKAAPLDKRGNFLAPVRHFPAMAWLHGTLQTGTHRISRLLQQPQDQGKAKGLAACNSQTASPFGCLNNFYFKILSNFLGSLQNRGCPAIYLVKKPCS